MVPDSWENHNGSNRVVKGDNSHVLQRTAGAETYLTERGKAEYSRGLVAVGFKLNKLNGNYAEVGLARSNADLKYEGNSIDIVGTLWYLGTATKC